MKKALIAMSGGVDSSVAAALTIEMGYSCIGVTMKLNEYDLDDGFGANTCCSLSDVEDARNVAHELGIPFYVFDFTDEFNKTVISHFVKAYLNGLTPNPCIECNRNLKFSRLLERAQELGCDKIVTGHYARTCFNDKTGRYELLRSKNSLKDQTYVLYMLTQEQLAHTLFPLGEFDDKERIREIAESHGFLNARKRDSQDICFVPDGDYASFIEKYTGVKSPHGSFVDTSGNIIGEHKGIIRYTIGQRRGLGLPMGDRVYVKDKDVASNTVTICDDNELYSKTIKLADFNFISRESIEEPLRVTAKIRYKHKEKPAYAIQTGPGNVTLEFDEPQRAPAKGQAAVLYENDTVVGGGIIT